MRIFASAQWVIYLSLPWWGWYFYRLLRVIQRRQFATMPRIYFWLNVYSMGFLPYLYNYELEQRLHAHLLVLPLPVVSLVKLLIPLGIVSYGYIQVVRRYSHFKLPGAVDGFLLAALAGIGLLTCLLHQQVTYPHLQRITSALICIATLVAHLSLLPMMRRLLHQTQNLVRQAHHRWMVLFLAASVWAIVLTLIDALGQLLTGRWLADTPLFLLAQACEALYLLAVAVLIGPDRHLFWAFYPQRLVTYWTLRQLAQRVQHDLPTPRAVRLPAVRWLTLAEAEFASYQLFVFLMDHYPALPADSRLRQRLAQIECADAPYPETVQALLNLNQEV